MVQRFNMFRKPNFIVEYKKINIKINLFKIQFEILELDHCDHACLIKLSYFIRSLVEQPTSHKNSTLCSVSCSTKKGTK